MSSTKEFVEYVCEQISEAGTISYRMMMGEYCIYCNAKVIGLVCNNQFFLKITKATEELLINCDKASAYNGAKLSYLITDLDNRSFVSELVLLTYNELPDSKPKKKKLK